jgi:hypothetical protein
MAQAGWGALVYSNNMRQIWYSWSKVDRWTAERDALSVCAAADGAVICCGKDVFIAFAQSGTGAYGWASDVDPKLAEVDLGQHRGEV